MDDKYLMENIMFGSKVVNDLYMHGAIESSNESVSVVFLKALQETMKMHYELYKAMEQAGFYSVENVSESKIEQLKQKIEKSCNQLENKE